MGCLLNKNQHSCLCSTGASNLNITVPLITALKGEATFPLTTQPAAAILNILSLFFFLVSD